jgi:hypothetical protein
MIIIIKQIQASITCEAKWLRWVWRKCKRKAKYTIYKAKVPTPPQTKPYGWQTPIPPPLRKSANREESRGLVKMSANCLSVSMYLISVSPFSTWSLRKVVSPLNMSHLFVEDWIFGYWDGTGVIAYEGDSLKPHSKISHGVHYLKNLWAAATYSTSVVDCATEDCFQED